MGLSVVVTDIATVVFVDLHLALDSFAKGPIPGRAAASRGPCDRWLRRRCDGLFGRPRRESMEAYGGGGEASGALSLHIPITISTSSLKLLLSGLVSHVSLTMWRKACRCPKTQLTEIGHSSSHDRTLLTLTSAREQRIPRYRYRQGVSEGASRCRHSTTAAGMLLQRLLIGASSIVYSVRSQKL